jgi:hypothetical protein
MAPWLCLAVAGSTAMAQNAPETVYAPPALPSEDEGVNQGAVHVDFNVSYFTDYVYRGVEVFEVPGGEDRLNLQLGTKLSFDLGKLPHPYVGVFVNVAENDPVSNFQEIRPSVGFDWTIKPIVISGGYVAYLYPDRTDLETSEVFLQVALDERSLFRGRPVPTPYVMAAYDFDLYDGIYVEGGLKYRLPLEDIGLTLTFLGNVAYVNGYNSAVPTTGGGSMGGFFTNEQTRQETITGFQHWEVGVIGAYSLNKLFNVSNRFGEWSVAGYLYYTESIEDDIRATDQVWGGAGITFHY